MIPDLIVVGAGLTGLVAALNAARTGLNVKIIAKGLGALHWNAGSIDALGYYPDNDTAVKRPLETIQELALTNPHHPYSMLDSAGLADSLEGFAALTEEMDLAYAGGQKNGENLWLPSPVGAARPTFLAPHSQIAGDLCLAEPILVVGLRGMRDFYPELIAQNLVKLGHASRAAFLPLTLITNRNDNNNVLLAHALENLDTQMAFAAELGKLVRPGERIGLPAILGMDDHPSVMNRLKEQLGVPVFEIPTLPPSVPGIRLNAALRRRLEKQGVRVELNADVIGFKAEGHRVAMVETETSGRPLKHRAGKFLLATGGILGGGINSDRTGRVWEVVLELPVEAPRRRAEWFHDHFFDPAGHPIFGAGVPVDRHFQPVDAGGARVYENVWAAGSLLAHADPIMERSLEAIAISTGTAAARFAAN